MKISFGLVLILCIFSKVYGEDSANSLMFKKGYVAPLEYVAGKKVKVDPAELIFNKTIKEVTCAYMPIKPLNEFILHNANALSIYLPCEGKNLSGAKFNDFTCQMANTCMDSLTGNSKEEKKLVKDELLNFVTKDFVARSLRRGLPEIERFEKLRVFAQVKKEEFNLASEKIGEKCHSLNDFSNFNKEKCNNKEFNEYFVADQQKCEKTPALPGCFNDQDETKIKGFNNFNKTAQNQNSSLTDYSNYRIHENLKIQLRSEESYVEKLGELFLSDKFKKASDENKAQLLVEHLKKYPTIDPVLGYLFKANPAELKKEDILSVKSLQDLYGDKKLTAASFKKSFNAYRKSILEDVLAPKGKCPKLESLMAMCSQATAISKGQNLLRSDENLEKDSASVIADEQTFKKIKNILGDKYQERFFASLVTAERCEVFRPGKGYQQRTREDDQRDDIISLANINVDSKRNSETSFLSDLKINPLSDVGDISKAIAAPVAAVDNPAIAVSAPPQAVQVQPAAVSSVPEYRPSAYAGDEGSKGSMAENKKNNNELNDGSQSSAVDNKKISDLNKRLADAEERMAQMKASGDKAEIDRATEKKNAEDAALLKDLKDQISGLKKNQEIKASASKVAEAAAVSQKGNDVKDSTDSTFSSSSNRSEIARALARPENYDQYRDGVRSENYLPTSGSSGSKSSIANSNGGLTLTAASSEKGLILAIFTIDGMSSEKAAETISNRIIELKGAPFYIEEAGMMKEIIPLMKDGKVVLDEKGNPVFEKIVKGKKGDKKFAKIKDTKRAPAAITTAADLKLDDEAKLKALRERAEYLKLQNLTNGIIDN